MRLIMLSITWSVFWIGYTLNLLNSGRVFVKPAKSYAKEERPLLYHFELAVSVIWLFSGYIALFFILKDSL